MGLKSDIYDALVKNLGEEYINNSSDGQKKIDTLANDLSIAIRDFILAQTFRVDKLTASDGPVSTSPILPVPSAGGPVPVPPRTIPVVTVDVDKDGGPSPAGGGIVHSNNSEVRLRKDEIAKGSL